MSLFVSDRLVKVTYCATGFLEKNNDTLQEDLRGLLLSSRIPFLRQVGCLVLRAVFCAFAFKVLLIVFSHFFVIWLFVCPVFLSLFCLSVVVVVVVVVYGCGTLFSLMLYVVFVFVFVSFRCFFILFLLVS